MRRQLRSCRRAAGGPFAGVLHCFSSGQELAETAVDLGLYVSFSGILTFKKSDKLRTIATRSAGGAAAGRDRCAVSGAGCMRGRRNEPAFVGHTLAALAACRGMTVAAMAEQTGRTSAGCSPALLPSDN
ncbi:MAG: TatD family hydrolase [Rhodospirillales bacterium]